MRKLFLSFASLLLASISLTAQAIPVDYYATLNGASELPANASPGTGWALLSVDTAAMTMRVQAAFQNLLGTTTASHVHCCTLVANTGTAGVATGVPTFAGFPLGVTSGSYDHLFDMTLASSYNAAFVTSHGGTIASAFAALVTGLGDGTSYFNIHSSFAGGGEIRGFIHAVPEPGTLTLLGLGALALGFARKRSLSK